MISKFGEAVQLEWIYRDGKKFGWDDNILVCVFDEATKAEYC